jgi:hypothetical protein
LSLTASYRFMCLLDSSNIAQLLTLSLVSSKVGDSLGTLSQQSADLLWDQIDVGKGSIQAIRNGVSTFNTTGTRATDGTHTPHCLRGKVACLPMNGLTRFGMVVVRQLS